MLEYSVPALEVVPAEATLTDAPFTNAREWPDHIAFNRKIGGEWTDVTCREFADPLADLAGGLIRAGIRTGDRVALMAQTSYEWMLCDYAILAAGAVTVPIYETSSAEQIEWYLNDSGAIALFVDSPGRAAVLDEVMTRNQLARETVQHRWRLDAGALDELSRTGKGVPREEIEQRRHSVGAASLATIVYTSGTTGRPKGCEILHGSLLAEMAITSHAPDVQEEVFNSTRSTLLFLPLAHILARAIQFTAVQCRVRLAHLGSVSQLIPELAAVRPTTVLAVPRAFEKLYNSVEHTAASQGHARIFQRAVTTAVAWSKSVDGGTSVGGGRSVLSRRSLVLRAQHLFYDRLVYAKLRAVMGGNIQYAVSGGGPLGEHLGHFFRGAGITVLEGYGLTETCAGITLNLPTLQRVGSVGRPLPGCSVRIAEDGEVQVKGPNVFTGYWHNPSASAEMLDDDGWLNSGDLGALDEDGYLTITGRKKDLIITAAGKNVAPAVLEDRVRAHWLVSQCVVVGEARPYIGALLTIDEDSFSTWKHERDRDAAATVAQLSQDPDLIADLQLAIDDANLAVSHAEAIKRFRVLPDDFTEQSAELTPTLKVKRSVILAGRAWDIEQLYA
jgi:long-chain acyl-CoA synthetase